MASVGGAVALRVIGSMVLVAAAVNGLSSVGLSSQHRPFTLHDDVSLGAVVDEHSGIRDEYMFYTQLRHVAAHDAISLPPDHLLDEEALSALALLDIWIEPVEHSSLPLAESPRARAGSTGTIHIVGERWCVILPYRIDASAEDGGELHARFHHRELVIEAASSPFEESHGQ